MCPRLCFVIVYASRATNEVSTAGVDLLCWWIFFWAQSDSRCRGRLKHKTNHFSISLFLSFVFLAFFLPPMTIKAAVKPTTPGKIQNILNRGIVVVVIRFLGWLLLFVPLIFSVLFSFSFFFLSRLLTFISPLLKSCWLFDWNPWNFLFHLSIFPFLVYDFGYCVRLCENVFRRAINAFIRLLISGLVVLFVCVCVLRVISESCRRLMCAVDLNARSVDWFSACTRLSLATDVCVCLASLALCIDCCFLSFTTIIRLLY